MTDEGPWEYKLDIVQILPPGTLTTEIESWTWSGERAEVPGGRFTLMKTALSLSIVQGDTFKYYRKLAGEVGWGGPLAFGEVYAREITDTDIIFHVRGILHKLKCRDIVAADYGAQHVVDSLLPVTRLSAGGVLGRSYAVIAPSIPDAQMERVQILQSSNYTSSGFKAVGSVGIVAAMNTAVTVEDQAFNFIATDGPLRSAWVRITHNLDLVAPQFVNVSIQQDVGGLPSGVPIDNIMFDANTIPGLGVWSWWKIDFLNMVGNENNLMLERGMQYWIVFEVIGVFGGRQIAFDAVDDPAPHARVTIRRLNAGNWTANQMKCMRFMVEQEGDWADVEDYDIKWCGDFGLGFGSIQIYFQKRNDVRLGDSGGFGNVTGISPTMMYDGQELCRVSYWCNFISFGSAITQWAYDWAVDLFDFLVVALSGPTVNYEVIHVENAKAWGVYKKFREVAPITIWLSEDAVGIRTLTIVDELTPADWAAMAPGAQAVRTFAHGHDTLVDNEVRLRITRHLEENIKETHALVIAGNNDGLVWGGHGDSAMVTTPGTGFANRDTVLVSDGDGIGGGGSFGGGIDTTEKEWDVTRQLRKSIACTISGFDQSLANLVYRDPNDLIHITDNMRGIPPTVLAVQKFVWQGPKADMVSLNVTCSDVVFEIIPSLMKAGAHPPGEGPARPNVNANDVDMREQGFTSLVRDLISPFTPAFRQLGEGLGSGVSLEPRTVRSQTGFNKKSCYTILHHEVGLIINPVLFWWINFGTGVPAGPALGNQIAQVMVTYPLPSVSGGIARMLCCHMARGDVGFRVPLPAVISEVGLAWSNTEVGARTDIVAWTLGNGSQIDQNPVQLNSSNRVAAIIRCEV